MLLIGILKRDKQNVAFVHIIFWLQNERLLQPSLSRIVIIINDYS